MADRPDPALCDFRDPREEALEFLRDLGRDGTMAPNDLASTVYHVSQDALDGSRATMDGLVADAAPDDAPRPAAPGCGNDHLAGLAAIECLDSRVEPIRGTTPVQRCDECFHLGIDWTDEEAAAAVGGALRRRVLLDPSTLQPFLMPHPWQGDLTDAEVDRLGEALARADHRNWSAREVAALVAGTIAAIFEARA